MPRASKVDLRKPMTDQISFGTLYTDGASRGNPGPAAIAYRLIGERGEVLAAEVTCVALLTNNEAEYRAVLAGLARCRWLGLRAVLVISDSELMVRQLTGEYRTKNARLAKLRDEVVELLRRDFLDVRFEHRQRADPDVAECDRMADAALTAAGHRRLPPPPWVRSRRRK